MQHNIVACIGAAIALSYAVTATKSAADTVTNNGQTMTADTKVIGGKVYVPLSDVAKSLGEVVVKSGGGYALTPAGGADQMANGLKGKVGDTIFTGQFRFTVTSFTTTTSYQEKYLINPETITADPGNKFVVLNCRIKNGTPIRQEIALDLSPYSGNDDTTLTDDQEQTYQPVNWHGSEFAGYDVHPGDTAPTGVWLLPGAAADFAVVFSIPQGSNPKDFIFGILKYNRITKGKQTDIRISLTNP